jgi:hypothetical protein
MKAATKTSPSQKLRLKTVKANIGNRRCFVTAYDPLIGCLTLRCREGHVFKKIQKDWQRITGFMKLVTRQPDGYWTDRGGGVSTLCPICWKAKRKEILEGF